MVKKVSFYITKILICAIITLLVLIISKVNLDSKNVIKKYLFDETFDFMKFNSWYSKLSNTKKNKEVYVSKELFDFVNKTKISNGMKYNLEKETIINALTGGIVIFIGDKDNIGNTVIIQGSDGFDIWYSNIETNDLKLYDYVEKGDIIGVSSTYINLIITKDNNYYTYEEYKKI